ncbi:GvpL/GvpF family gas vesicle protein [Streptomyces sp. NPDC054849]
MNTPLETLTYVYAVARPTEPLREALAGLSGIDRAPVRLLLDTSSDASDAALAFVISAVSARDFNEIALKEHFEDVHWLEYVARAHHEVVQTVAAHATVLPLRMATVYQDDSRARQALVEQRDTFARRLAHLEAHTEYGVKIYLTPFAPPTTGEPSADVGAAAPTTPGKAYLQRRRAQHDTRERVYRQAQQAAAAIDAIAARHTSQRVRHAPQSGALTGPRENVLNDAYLVPDQETERFRTAIAQAAQDFPDISIEVTGPWAPYSFAMPPPDTPVATRAPDPSDDVQGQDHAHKRAP